MTSVFRLDTAFNDFIPQPSANGLLSVSDLHQIYWEEVGAPNGVPVVVLHGGPGGDIRPYYKRLIDGRLHRGIFFEQRGCGRSRPFGCIEDNSTQRSIDDMEKLRQHRSVDRWVVVGGSWGSSLALAYAQQYPDRVAALIVSGVFLCRDEDVDWWWNGARTIFPEVYAGRDDFLTDAERADPRAAFNARIQHPDPAISEPAAVLLSHIETQALDLWPPTPPEDLAVIAPSTLVYSRMLSWYDCNNFFFEPDQLIRDAGRLAGIPGAIISGRADMCTPPKGAWDLSRVWSDARLTIVAAAGHRWSDELLGRVVVGEIARLAAEVGIARPTSREHLR